MLPPAACEHLPGHQQLELPAAEIDPDPIAVRDEGDRPAAGRFRGDVADGGPVGGAGEAPVGDEGAGRAEAGPHQRGGGAQHLAHSGTSPGSLVADDDAGAGLDPVAAQRVDRALLVLEDARGEDDVPHLPRYAGCLHDGPPGREVAAEDVDRAVRLDRVAPAANALGVADLRRFDQLPGAPPGHGPSFRVDEVAERLHDRRDAPRLAELGHPPRARRGELDQGGRLAAEPIPDVEAQLHPGFLRHGDHVKDHVGGAADGHPDPHGVVEGLRGQDPGRTEVLPEQLHDPHTRVLRRPELVVAARGEGARMRQREAEGLRVEPGGIPRGRGVARAGEREVAVLEAPEVLLREVSEQVLADPIVDRLEEHLAIAPEPRPRRPAVEQDGGKVEPRGGHHHPGHHLVARPDEDHGVETMALDHELDHVGDEVAARKHVAHAVRCEGLAVGDMERVELARRPARHANPRLDRVAHLPEVDVLGREILVRVDDRDHRPPELFVDQPGALRPGPLQRALDPEVLLVASQLRPHAMRPCVRRAARRLFVPPVNRSEIKLRPIRGNAYRQTGNDLHTGGGATGSGGGPSLRRGVSGPALPEPRSRSGGCLRGSGTSRSPSTRGGCGSDGSARRRR